MRHDFDSEWPPNAINCATRIDSMKSKSKTRPRLLSVCFCSCQISHHEHLSHSPTTLHIHMYVYSFSDAFLHFFCLIFVSLNSFVLECFVCFFFLFHLGALRFRVRFYYLIKRPFNVLLYVISSILVWLIKSQLYKMSYSSTSKE